MSKPRNLFVASLATAFAASFIAGPDAHASVTKPGGMTIHASSRAWVVTPVPVSWRVSPPLARGVELWARGKRAKAVRQFREAVKLLPQDPVAWHNLGVSLFYFKRFEAALVAFRHEWHYNILAPSGWYGIGQCHLKLNQLPQAENAFVMAVVRAPQEGRYWHALAHALHRQGKLRASRAAEARAQQLKVRPARVPWNPAVIRSALADLRFPRITRSR